MKYHCFIHPNEYYDDVCPKCTQEEKEMNQTREMHRDQANQTVTQAKTPQRTANQ